MLQVDLLHHSILGRRARVQSDDHHVQANLPAAKTTTHTIRNRNIETAKLACFLNSLRPSLIRVVRRKKIERTKRKIGIAAARKAMILKIILSVLRRGPCRLTRRHKSRPRSTRSRERPEATRFGPLACCARASIWRRAAANSSLIATSTCTWLRELIVFLRTCTLATS